MRKAQLDKKHREQKGNVREEIEKKLLDEKNPSVTFNNFLRKAITGDPQGWFYVLIVMIIVATIIIL